MRETIRTLLFGLAVGAILTGLTGPATAAEQLQMPFACRVAGGDVLLAPSAPQTYRIYGHREHKRLTTCSPFDARKCHNWSVHRFDLDCGGVRTSWQSVVAALSPMLSESLGPFEATYGPSAGPAYAPRGGARPGPGQGIAFPPGFAPNPMKVASFKRTKPAPAQIALPPIPSKKPISTAPAQIAEIEPSLKPDDASKTSPAEPKATEVAKDQALQIVIDSGSAEVTGSLPQSGAPSSALSGALWRDAGMVFALTLAALLALSATLLLRRRRMLPLPMPATLPQLHWPALPGFARASVPGTEREAAQPRDVPATRLRLWDEDWLPGTMSEALDVLGVDPDASRSIMKTTVTRLRRALHPDHAIDEEDRTLRERRLKQINVAWDIVSGKRRALWLSVKPRSS